MANLTPELIELRNLGQDPAGEYIIYLGNLKYIQAQLSQLPVYPKARGISRQLSALIEQVVVLEAYTADDEDSLKILSGVVVDTYHLLTGKLSPQRYKEKAQHHSIEGNPSNQIIWKLLGGIIIALGALVAAVGVGMVCGGGVLPGIIVGGIGVCISGWGHGIFKGGKPTGLSKTMDNLASECEVKGALPASFSPG